MIEINKYKLDSSSICLPGTITTWGAIIGDISNQSDLVSYINEHGGGVAAEWGSITGVLSDQTDLMTYMSSFATMSWVEAQGYLTEVPSGYATESFVTSALSGYATQSWVQSQDYAPESWVTDCLNAIIDKNIPDALEGYATESWVGQQGYITSSALNGYATQSWVSGQISSLASWTTDCLNAIVDKNIPDALEGYATESWVGQQGYASDSDLTSLASRVTALETNYGDAITITNNILG